MALKMQQNLVPNQEVFMLLKLIENFLRNRKTSNQSPEKSQPKDSAREKLQENFLLKDQPTKQDDYINKKNQSMSDSQGVSDFSGSGYNGPGNVDREKTNSNMGQRNFER
jgi:hypothetical protein